MSHTNVSQVPLESAPHMCWHTSILGQVPVERGADATGSYLGGSYLDIAQVAVESAAHPGIAMPVRAQQMVKADHMSILMHPDTLSFILDALYQRI
jgi:hypothetical protein